MTINTNKNPELVHECETLMTEIRSAFEDELSPLEIRFLNDLEHRITCYGEFAYITHTEKTWLDSIYERIC